MELKRAICTTCGHELEVDRNSHYATCSACGNKYFVEHAVDLSNKNENEIKQLQNYRINLDRAIAVDDLESIKSFSENLISLIPKDYKANYFYSYAQSKLNTPRYFYDFLQNTSIEATEEDVDVVLNHIIEYSDLRDRLKIIDYLKEQNEELIDYYNEVFEKRKALEDNYSLIDRDVFICHRSTDQVIAEKIVQSLENDANACWISSRNLRPNDNENYWDNIKDAIESCEIFLVVSSNDAMVSKDVQKEIDIAKKLDKRRLEFKIDDSKPTTLFKHFFDGIKWINAYVDSNNAFLELNQRVYDLLFDYNEPTEVLEPKEISPTVQTLVKRLYLELELGNFDIALQNVNRILDIEVESSDAWICRLLIKYKLRNIKEFRRFINGLKDLKVINDVINSNEYRMAKRFGGDDVHFKSLEEIIYVFLGKFLLSAIKQKDSYKLDRVFTIKALNDDKLWNIILHESDDFERLKLFKRASKLNNASAQYQLGNCYRNGKGVYKSEKIAIKWYKKAASFNYTRAQCTLGTCYQYGIGVTKSYRTAFKWYKRAALLGNAKAQNNVGVFYEKGHGVRKSNREAALWYKKAAKQKHAHAQYNLGNCYQNGIGVLKAPGEAANWFKKAALQNHPAAQYRLGLLYELGIGVEKSLTESVVLYKEAAKNGHEPSRKKLKEIW